jgi:eukaryotic-like serine/threonine-protein kinase
LPNVIKSAGWGRVQELFLASADLPLEEQRSFLDRSCAADPALREEVDSLLAADRKCGAGIANAIERGAAAIFDSAVQAGERLGAYRVLREIGRGGMGAVYLAARDDDRYRKQVAIKVVKRGMDTAEVLARFHRERQILANLDHPHIAHLLDAGTTGDGRPFFVMDYVEGVPVDVFCREHNLNIDERCRLFLKICDAVAHAHRNLIVHRDLKPANIFITADGTPKLLDFGVAKLLNQETAGGITVTAVAQPLTPEYASPEQVLGQSVTTAADVYGRGAVLYEVLTGTRAQSFKARTPAEIERAVCEIEVEPPSRRVRGLDPDLDNIVLLAMRKDPERRYRSVDQLSEDVRRYLDGRTVLARPDSLGYRTRKFARRNRVAIAVASIFAAGILGAAIVATVQARRATREQARAIEQRERAVESQARAEASRIAAEQAAAEADRQRGEAERHRQEAERQRSEADLQRTRAETERQIADRRFEQVRQLAGKFLLQFDDAIRRLPGSTAAQKMVVETGLQYYDTLVKESHGDRELLKEIARGYDRLGDVQGNPFRPNLGNPAGALESFRKALAIRESLNDSAPDVLTERIQSNIRIAQVLITEGDVRQGRSILEKALALGAGATDFHVREATAGAYQTYAKAICQQSDPECLPANLKFLDMAEALARDHGQTPADQNLVRLAQSSVGTVYSSRRQADAALPHLRAAMEIDQHLLTLDGNNALYLRDLFEDYLFLAMLFRTSPQLAREDETSIRSGEAGAELADRLLALDPRNINALRDVVQAQIRVGDWVRDHEDVPGSIIHYRKAMEAASKLSAAGAPSALSDDHLRQAHSRLGEGLGMAGQLDEALTHFRQAEEILDRADKARPPSNILFSRANLAAGRGAAYRKSQIWPRAIEEYQKAIDFFTEQRRQHPENEALLDAQTELSFEQADCFAGNKQWNVAIEKMQGVLAKVKEMETRRPLTPEEGQARAEGPGKIAAWTKAMNGIE